MIKKIFNRSIFRESAGFAETTRSEYSQQTAFYKIPEYGFTHQDCLNLITAYSNIVHDKVSQKQYSGTIYQDALLKKPTELNLYKTLQSLYLEIFQRAHMWNGLHNDEFGIANLINLQVVACVADLFGGKREDVHGIVTTGGTQSIMTSARAYMNYGIHERGLARHECTIVAPDTIHCSLTKASQAYGFKLILLPTDKHGRVSDETLCDTVEKHHKNLVALYCSYPSYPYGTKDNILLFAHLAEEHQIGLHVDCCLGGFVVNFIDNLCSQLLQTPGITSLSVDTHKNGLCPKGSSVLITKRLNERNLFYYAVYVIPDWSGGLYGTPNDEGSSTCVPAFCALITLLYYGKDSYRKTAKQIHECARMMIDELHTIPEIEIISPDITNVVALRVTLGKGATYRLNDLMSSRGYVFNTMTNDIIHFCITKRFVQDPHTLTDFLMNFRSSIREIISELQENPDIEYDGNARMYCSADTVKQLNDESSVGKYLENYFFGIQGISAVIKEHFMASNNPFNLSQNL